jgi:hypothetical protein
LTEKPTETKKKKVEKDPNAPKRNLSSYMLYTQAVRPKVVAEHPDMKAIEIAKFVGEMWNKLSEKEKMVNDSSYASLCSFYLALCEASSKGKG